MATLESVPDEIIRHILEYLSPEETFANIQLVSKAFNRVANEPLLWKYYCLASFRYWDEEHHLSEKLQLRASQTAWRKLWRRRKRRNTEISRLLDDVITSKVGRLQRIGEICRYGYDAKDLLVAQCRTDDSAGDVLARRYYANTVLASIHRSVAVHEWSQYQERASFMTVQGLDRALAAFDMFFVREDESDIDDTCALLDRLAADFMRQQPKKFEALSARDKALALLKWVRQRNLVGMDEPEENYRNLRNCLIGYALRDERHPSLPIISAAIYTCLAERIGLRAACAAFPSHVHAMVMAPPGRDLDGKETSAPANEADKMFLDPYGSGEEIQYDDLRSRLVELDWINGRDAFLVAAPVPVMVYRVGRNLSATFGTFWNSRQEELAALNGRPSSKLTVESAAYAARWANLLVTPLNNFQWDSTLDQFLNQVAQQFPEDSWLVEEYIVPLYQIFTQSIQPRIRFTWENVPEMLGIIRNMDNRQPTVSRRYTQEIHQNVWYTVGQVFRHKRYGYIGIINGWGERGTQSLPMPHNMSFEEAMDEMGDSGTDSDTVRQRLRKKTFYTCLKHDHDRHVVAQDRIEIVRDPRLIPDALMHVAGKFFKRFDRKTCTFVSNIKEYFPDD
ncbi:hypothetical protein VPNG_07809 [Cytospora leucostoma]|uniref:F-box domain-containing protein n=1 Tax=Cytospora leucostoma TaxID=1230097 RepID=A0A423WEH0_9PEZI|nr:hypothetical protein VPNG_07809 [Cytospora leucostoma]